MRVFIGLLPGAPYSLCFSYFFFFSSRRRHTRCLSDWSSDVCSSDLTYIYIRGEYAWIVDILEQAIAEAKINGWLGKNILGTGFDCEIYVHRGAGAYI